MVARAWVFRCDDCGEAKMVYTETRSVAVEAAKQQGWLVIDKSCWCITCAAQRLGHTL
jgi:hypothetical protein